MEGSGFSFKFLSSLSIRCNKVNVSKGLSNQILSIKLSIKGVSIKY